MNWNLSPLTVWTWNVPKVHVLKDLSPAGDAILGGSGNFSKWGLAGGSGSPGGGSPWGLYLVLGPSLLLSAYVLHEVTFSMWFPVTTMMFCLTTGPESMEPRLWTEISRTRAKINPSWSGFCQVFGHSVVDRCGEVLLSQAKELACEAVDWLVRQQGQHTK
jgi:hypothetical protein